VRRDYPYYYDEFDDRILRIPGAKFCNSVPRFFRSPSVMQRHLFFGRVTHSHSFAIPLMYFSVAQLDLQHPDHSTT